MAEAQTAQAAAGGAQTHAKSACSTRSSRRAASASDAAGEGARQGPGQAVRLARCSKGSMTVGARHRGDDQRAHRADRSPDLAAAQRGHAPPDFQKLEGTWRGLQVPAVSRRETGDAAQDQGAQRRRRRICCGTCSGRRSSTRARCSRRCTRRSSASSAARRSARWSATTSSASRGQDIELLEKVSQVAAAAHAPFLTAARRRDVQPGELHRSSTRRATWRRSSTPPSTPSGRASGRREDSRYVALTLPRILMREPYGKDTVPVEAFDYEEHVDGTDHTKYLWGNAAWALGARMTQAFATYGWCATIRGVESGGLVEGLPVHNFQHRVGRHRDEVPDRGADHRPPREGAGRPRLRAAGALQGHATTRRSSACSRRRRPRSTTRTPRPRTRGSRRSCRTSSRCRASRTTSRR